MDLIPMVLLAPVLVAVAYFDLRFMRIPNVLTFIALGVVAVAFLFVPPADLWTRLAVAAIVLVLGVAAFAFRLIGGGDVKILPALLLAVPTYCLSIFANVFAASMIVGIVLVLALRRLPVINGLGWKTFGGSTKFPMGLSIAMSGLAFPLVVLAFRAG